MRLPLLIAAALMFGVMLGTLSMLLLGSKGEIRYAVEEPVVMPLAGYGGLGTGMAGLAGDQLGLMAAGSMIDDDKMGMADHGSMMSDTVGMVNTGFSDGSFTGANKSASMKNTDGHTNIALGFSGENGIEQPETVMIHGVDMVGPIPEPRNNHSSPDARPATAMIASISRNTPFGAVPSRSDDGETALSLYAKPSAGTQSGLPKVSVMVLDLGLDKELSEQAVELPDEIALGFSPYIANGNIWQRFVREHGHETVLSLPVEFDDPEAGDNGALAIGPDFSKPELAAGIAKVLSRGSGYVAVTSQAGMFKQDIAAFADVAEILYDHGVGFVELGGRNLEPAAQNHGLPYKPAAIALDSDLSPEAIERQLAKLEEMARRGMPAIAYTRPYPVVYDRLWYWARELESKGEIVLVPPSQLLAN